ncbi:MAG: mechanosensitive ion channel [Deltaproteobacteria bacterium]|jgi:small-conductance mechanosensitive channel|nr:mechanosensitive ion channel [Deltaproteobacteria bacterium]
MSNKFFAIIVTVFVLFWNSALIAQNVESNQSAAGTETASPETGSADSSVLDDKTGESQAEEAAPESLASVEHFQKLWQENSAKYTSVAYEISELLNSSENMSNLIGEVKYLMAEFNRFKLIFQTSAGHPTEQVEVLSNIKQMRQRLDLELGPLENNLNNLNLKLEEAINTKESISEMLESGDPVIVEYEQNLNQAIEKLQKVQTELEDTIKPIREAIATFDKSIADINTVIPTIWNNYYFGDTGSSGIFQIKKELFSWLDSLLPRMGFMFPQDKDARSQAGFRFVISIVIMAIVASLILTYDKALPEKFRDLLTSTIKGPWITMSLGLALIAASITPMGGNYLLLKLPGILLLIRSLATLSWNLRVWTNPALKDNHSPLHRFYVPAALGVAVLFSDLPPGAVTVCWLITMAAFLYYLKRNSSRSKSKQIPTTLPEYIAYGSGLYFALGSLLVAILGYSRLAILVFMCLFALANIIILGSALVTLTNMVCNYIFKPEVSPIKNALANALTVPCSFLISLVSALPWLLAVPGSAYLLDHVMNRGYSVGSASISFYRIFIIIMLILLFRSLGGLANTSMAHLSDKFDNLKSGFIQSLRTLMNYALWVLFAIVALSLLGVNFTSIILAATGFSVGISMGLQSIVNNLFSGLILILGGNVQIGNLIEVEGVIGKVVNISVRCTVIEPADSSWVYIPNSSLVNGRFINWTRNNRLVNRKLSFSTVYGTDLDKARELMLDVAMHTEYVAKVSPYLPSVTVVDLSENAVVLTLGVTILDIDQNASVQSGLREMVYKRFYENNINFYIGSSLDVNLVEPKPEPAKVEGSANGPNTTKTDEGQSGPPVTSSLITQSPVD